MKEAYAKASNLAYRNATRGKKYYDRKVRSTILKPGDRVLVRNLTPKGGPGKLRFFGRMRYTLWCHGRAHTALCTTSHQILIKRNLVYYTAMCCSHVTIYPVNQPCQWIDLPVIHPVVSAHLTTRMNSQTLRPQTQLTDDVAEDEENPPNAGQSVQLQSETPGEEVPLAAVDDPTVYYSNIQ